MSVSFLHREGQPALAYRYQKRVRTDLPLVLFCGGFRSDMEGTKAAYLAEQCEKAGRAYVRFDYRGHGKSEGIFEEGTIGLWKDDALSVIDMAEAEKIVIVGSSMGGWISLLCALERKDRICGLVGLAAAPDFTREIRDMMDENQRGILDRQGWVGIENDYAEPYKITKNLIEEGDAHCLLDGSIDIEAPVRLVQGMMDTDVVWQTAHRISDALSAENKKVYLVEDGDHRLSRPEDLALIWRSVEEVSTF